MLFNWSDASALYQLQHGADGTRTNSARIYLEMRLDGWTSEEISDGEANDG